MYTGSSNLKKKAFSMLEVVAAVLVMSLLSLIAYSYVSGNITEAENAKAVYDLRIISEAVNMHYLNNHSTWPTSLEEIVGPGKELSEIPLDPWGRAYLLDEFFYKVVSKGPDGKLDVPFRGADPGTGVKNYPGKWDGDDFYQCYYERPVLFTARLNGTTYRQLHQCNLDGRNIRQLSNLASDHVALYPCFSPDSSLVCYAGHLQDLFMYDCQSGTNTTFLSDGRVYARQTFSPDGSVIAFWSNSVSNGEIFFTNLRDTTVPKPWIRVTATQDDGFGSRTSFPQFSPDGKKLLCVTSFLSDTDVSVGLYDVPTGGKTVEITFANRNRISSQLDGEWNTFFRFSPDGQKLVFHTIRWGGINQIAEYSFWEDSVKQLTFEAEESLDPCYCPDGKRIVFYRKSGLYDELFIMNSDGSNQTRITSYSDDSLFHKHSPVFPQF